MSGGWKVKTSDETIEEIRELRYLDGLTAKRVAEMLGVGKWTVLHYAPGRPGKVAVAPLREAFLTSAVTAGDVARHMGWFDSKGSVDTSRVRRTLGLQDDVSGSDGRISRRTLVDAETVMLIAEAIGVSPWSVLPEEET